MAQWQPLPESTRPELRLLVAELRHLKHSSGLSLAGLAARTTYSKSAWHRYLNGGNLPPRDAVDAFGALGGAEHHARLLDLWDRAARPPQPRTEPPATPVTPVAYPVPSEPAPPEPAPPARRSRRRTLTIAAALALLGSAAWAAVPHVSHATPAAPAPSACRGDGCQGRDPARSACRTDARTQSALTTASYAVRLRFSPSCDTIWSEVRSSSTGADTESPMLMAPDPRQAEACAEVGRTMMCTGHTQDGP
ncbi:XRE family transcriptional regulator [Streptomyces sp. NBC_00083]|uniref:helix-turn-helix domain-containing protein n=1 Tax=Streptomyces sp. NBC_00083 TaxID=2975647 RepID=UPI00224D254C|nr:XRE family transcriptional regulator [Streptomyces sp. NBC_00083]MCX5388212.1 XRE family transcriptional regulator [Streptomyces sp. NBC_00083]